VARLCEYCGNEPAVWKIADKYEWLCGEHGIELMRSVARVVEEYLELLGGVRG